MEDLSSIFNLSADSLLKPEPQKGESELYRPDAKMGKDNVYKAIIRWLPNLLDPSKTIVSKWSVWLEDPVTEQKMSVDCPSSIGKPSILQDVYFSLKKSDSATDKKLSEIFSRREVFFSLVKIIKDEQQPELEGKVKVFKYGRKIYNKLHGIMKPDDGMRDPHNPFDLVDGRPFLLHIKIVAGYNNYDDSEFVNKKVPLEIDGTSITNDAKWVPQIRAYYETLPNLSKYSFQEWTPEVEQHVKDTIKHSLPAGRLAESIYKKHNISSGGASGKARVTSEIDEFEEVSAPKASAKRVASPVLEEDADLDLDSLAKDDDGDDAAGLYDDI